MVVTGAAGGIGRALALRCAAEGARVAATDIQHEPLQRVADELGDGHLAVAADVTDEEALGALISRVESELGPVEVFFANAGVAIGEDPVSTPDEVWDLAFGVNVRAHILAARRLVPGWLERGEGYFVATASAAGLLTQIGSAPYAVDQARRGGVRRVAIGHLRRPGDPSQLPVPDGRADRDAPGRGPPEPPRRQGGRRGARARGGRRGRRRRSTPSGS